MIPTSPDNRPDKGVPASPSGCQPSASAVPASRSGIPNAGDSAHERSLKYLGELTLQRRIQEHAREKAKRELAYAQGELDRIDAEAMRLVDGWTKEWSEPEPASAMSGSAQDREDGLDPKGASAAAEGGDAQ